LSGETVAVTTQVGKFGAQQSAVKKLREHISENAGDPYLAINQIVRRIIQDDIVDSSLGRESNRSP